MAGPISESAGVDRRGRKETSGLAVARLSGEKRVLILIAILAAVSAALFLGPVRDIEALDAPYRFPLWALVGLFVVAEVAVVIFQVDRNALHITLAEIPLVMGLFFGTATDLVVAQVVGAMLVLGLYRRQSSLKFAFNIASYALQTNTAVLVFHTLLDAGHPLGPRAWAAALAATLTASLLSVPLVHLAIALAERRFVPRIAPVHLLFAGMVTTMNASIMLLAVTLLWIRPATLPLLLVPTGLLFLAFQAYAKQKEKREAVESLYESTRVTQASLESTDVLTALLSQTLKMFKADVAQVTLFSEDDPKLAYRAGLTADGEVTPLNEVELDPREGVWARVASEGEAILVPRPIGNHRLRVYFAGRGVFKDAMVAPLFGKKGVVGTLLVGDRLGDVTTFDTEDLKLLATLANHASISLENARLVERLRESLAHATEMNRLKDDFVAAVSHELRTPLTSIQGYVKTLLRPEIDRLDAAERRSFLESIDRAGERLRVLIEDLLVVARLEASELEATASQVNLHMVADQVIAELGDRLADREVTVAFAADVTPVETDPGKVHQIMSNLVENAIKYSPAGRSLEIEGAMEGRGVTVTVRDHGDGIAPEEHAKIFERFYQVDGSMTREQGGTGLGLYLCRRLGESIGGRVWLQSSGPEGSVFALWVPLAFTPAAATSPALDLGDSAEGLLGN